MTLREDILEEYGPYCPPNRGRALRHYYHECSHHFMFSFWRTKISDLTEFGSHMLYLSLLWYLSMAFAALLAMLGLPLIVAYSAKGNFFANGVLRKATLGNYGPIYVEGALRAGGVYDLGFTNEEVEANITTYYRNFDASTSLNAISVPSSWALNSKEAELTVLAYLDATVCIACFVLAYMARTAQQHQADSANKEALTIASYTIQVQGLPPEANSQQIAAFFENNIGPVAKLNVQRDCRRLISLGMRRHAARLATERTLQRILKHGCGCGSDSSPPSPGGDFDETPPPIGLDSSASPFPDGSTPNGQGADHETPSGGSKAKHRPQKKLKTANALKANFLAAEGGLAEPVPLAEAVEGASDDHAQDATPVPIPDDKPAADANNRPNKKPAKPNKGWSDARLQRQVARLKVLQQNVLELTNSMHKEARRSRSIVSAFVTFSAAAYKHQALKRAKLPPARNSHTQVKPGPTPGHPKPGFPAPSSATHSQGAAARNGQDLTAARNALDEDACSTPIPPWQPGRPPLTITPAGEPADILYHHLGVSGFERFVRRFALTVLKYVVVLGVFVISSVADTMREEGGGAEGVCVSCGVYDESGGVAKLSSEQRSQFSSCASSGEYEGLECTETQSSCLQCYCNALLFAAPITDLSFCPNQLAKVVRVLGVNLSLTTITTVLNLFLQVYSGWATEQEVHTGRTAAEASNLQAQFLAQLLNTVVVGVIADSKIQAITAIIATHLPVLQGRIFAGLFSDISPNWYKFVGSKLLSTLIIQAAVILAKPAVLYTVNRWFRHRAQHALTQPDMNKAMQGTEFLLAPRYGEVLNVAALSLVFAATMPLMLLVIAPMLALAFFLQLAELLHVSRRPPAAGAELANMALQNIPLMITMHLAWSLWAFSFSHINTPPPVDISVLLNYTVVPVATFLFSSEEASELVARVTQAHSLPILLALLLLSAVFLVATLLQSELLRTLIYPVAIPARMLLHLLRMLRVLPPPRTKRAQEVQSESIAAFNVALRTHLLIGPSSYTLADNPHYHQAFSTRHWNPAQRRHRRAQLQCAGAASRCSASVCGGSQRAAGAAAGADDSSDDDASNDIEAPSEEWKNPDTAQAEAAVATNVAGSDTRSHAHSDLHPQPLKLPEPSSPENLPQPPITHKEHSRLLEPEHSLLPPPQPDAMHALHASPDWERSLPSRVLDKNRGWGGIGGLAHACSNAAIGGGGVEHPGGPVGRLEAIKAAKREQKKAKLKDMFSLDLDIEDWDP